LRWVELIGAPRGENSVTSNRESVLQHPVSEPGGENRASQRLAELTGSAGLTALSALRRLYAPNCLIAIAPTFSLSSAFYTASAPKLKKEPTMDDQLKQSALDFHQFPTPGKIQVSPT